MAYEYDVEAFLSANQKELDALNAESDQAMAANYESVGSGEEALDSDYEEESEGYAMDPEMLKETAKEALFERAKKRKEQAEMFQRKVSELNLKKFY